MLLFTSRMQYELTLDKTLENLAVQLETLQGEERGLARKIESVRYAQKQVYAAQAISNLGIEEKFKDVPDGEEKYLLKFVYCTVLYQKKPISPAEVHELLPGEETSVIAYCLRRLVNRQAIVVTADFKFCVR